MEQAGPDVGDLLERIEPAFKEVGMPESVEVHT